MSPPPQQESAEPLGTPAFAGRRAAALLHLLLNYASTLFLVIKGVILVPAYLRHFGTDGYGAWLASGNVLSLLGLVESGLVTVYAQRLSSAHGAKDGELFARITGGGALLLTTAAAVLAAAAFALARWVPGWVNAPMELREQLALSFVLTGGGTALAILQTVVFSLFYAWQRPLAVGLIRFGTQLLEVVAIVFGLSTGLGLVTLGASSLAAGALGFGAVLVVGVTEWRRRNLPAPAVDRGTLEALFKSTVPLFVSRIGAVVLGNNDAIVLSTIRGPAAAAVLVLTDRSFKVGQMLVNPVAGSVFYGVAHLASDASQRDRIKLVLAEVFEVASVVTALVFGGALALNPGFMALWVGPEQFGGLPVSIALGMAGILIVRGNLAGMMLSALGSVEEAGWCSLAELLVRLPLMFLLLDQLGLVGLPLAVAGAALLTSSWLYPRAIGRRLGLGGWTAARLLVAGWPTLLATSLVGLAASALLPVPATWWHFAVEAVATGAVLSALVLGVSPLARRYAARLAARSALRLRGAAIGP